MLKITAIGRITKDSEIKESQSGVTYTNFDLAINTWNSQTKENDTTFIRCFAFDKSAEIIVNNTQKGSRIFIEGELKITKNESDGVTYTNVDVLVRNFELIDFREKEEEKPKQAPAKKSNSRKELPF